MAFFTYVKSRDLHSYSVHILPIQIIAKTKSLYVTGFARTVLKGAFCISKNINLKYLSHCDSLVLQCSHARHTV